MSRRPAEINNSSLVPRPKQLIMLTHLKLCASVDEAGLSRIRVIHHKRRTADVVPHLTGHEHKDDRLQEQNIEE